MSESCGVPCRVEQLLFEQGHRASCAVAFAGAEPGDKVSDDRIAAVPHYVLTRASAEALEDSEYKAAALAACEKRETVAAAFEKEQAAIEEKRNEAMLWNDGDAKGEELARLEKLEADLTNRKEEEDKVLWDEAILWSFDSFWNLCLGELAVAAGCQVGFADSTLDACAALTSEWLILTAEHNPSDKYRYKQISVVYDFGTGQESINLLQHYPGVIPMVTYANDEPNGDQPAPARMHHRFTATGLATGRRGKDGPKFLDDFRQDLHKKRPRNGGVACAAIPDDVELLILTEMKQRGKGYFRIIATETNK